MPSVRIQDNLQLSANAYVVYIKEIEVGRGDLRPNMLLVMDPRGDPITPAAAIPTTEPTLRPTPARWVPEIHREEGDVPRLHHGGRSRRP